MSWRITICSNKEIGYEEADEIVSQLPKELRGHREEMGYAIKNGENWSAGCDIYAPKNREWTIGGSSMSSQLSEKMALHLTNELEKRNHEIKIIGDFYLDIYRIPVDTREGAEKILEGYMYSNLTFVDKKENSYFFQTNHHASQKNHTLKVEITEETCTIYKADAALSQNDEYDFEVEESFTIAEVKEYYL